VNTTRPDYRSFDDIPEELYKQFPPCSWTVGTHPSIYFPVLSISESGGARIVERKRPFRRGAKLDDTGREAYRWKLSAVFHNSIQEEGMEINGEPLYPDVLNSLLGTLGTGETGDLILPTRGIVRARFASYNRLENFDSRDYAAVELEFIEDNEDKATAEGYTALKLQGSAETMIEEATFSAQSEGSWSGSLEDLTELVRSIEGYASAPGDYRRDIESQTKAVMALHQRVVAANQKAATTGRDAFFYPTSHKAQRDLATLSDMVARERQAARMSITSIVCGRDQSLADVAVMVGQPIEDLLTLNFQLEDPFFIEAGTVVRVMNASK
jgi:prophage DNA circulation protein